MSWFFVTHSFMREKLQLKCVETAVYAIIYGFTEKTGNFSGSLDYLSNMAGLEKSTVFKTVKKLVGKGVINKKNILKNGKMCCIYTAVPLNELTLPEKQEKPKRKTKQKTAAKPSNLTVDYETVENASNHITDDENAVKTQENENKPPDFELTADEPTKIRQPESEVLTPIQIVWQAYKQAYIQRYGIEPLRNAKIFGQIKNFIAMVGEKDAPNIAAYYVTHNRAWYVQKGHDIGTLLMNAQVIAKDFYTGYQTTGITAKWAEETETARTAAEQAKMLIRQAHFKKQQKTA